MTLEALALFIVSSVSIAKTPVNGPPPKEVLRQLAKDGYFKVATCREIADTVLSRLGLPETGKSGPIAGKRGGFDRSKQTAERPVLSDGVTTPDGTKVKVTMKERAKSSWQVTIEREKGEARLATRFDFERADGHRPTCDLVAMSFKQNEIAKPITAEACVGYFNVAEIPTIRNAPMEQLAWSKDDCTFALHYSREARGTAQN